MKALEKKEIDDRLELDCEDEEIRRKVELSTKTIIEDNRKKLVELIITLNNKIEKELKEAKLLRNLSKL